MTSDIQLPIYVDNKKTLIFTIKDYTLTLEELRESLENIIPDSYVYIKRESNEDEYILTEDEQYIQVKEILIDNSVHFKTQERIKQDKNIADDHLELLVKGISINDPKPTADGAANNNTADNAASTAPNTGNDEKKRSSLMNINVVDNRSKIIEYCSTLALKSAIDCETFKSTDQVVEWDINNALIYPAQDSSVSYLTRSTFNSIEHNALKSGLYSWNGGVAFKSIIDASHTGSVQTDENKNSTSSTAYSYTHCMVARYVLKIRRQDIKINNETITLLKSVSKDLDKLKELLKTIEYFPTQYIFGGKIASTAYKKNCTESDKEQMSLKLQTDFKASLLNSDALKANVGGDITRNKSNDSSSKLDYSYEETIICGGDTTLRDEFDKFILSLESYNNCNIIEISNLLSIWDILLIQDKALYDECKSTLGIDEKTFKIDLLSNIGSKSYSKFIINGKDINCGNNKGFNVVLLNSSGTKIDSKNFDTCSRVSEFFINRSYKFARYLEKVDNGKVILISVNDDGFYGLKEVGRKALTDLDVKYVDSFSSNSSFCAIIKKGQNNTVQDSTDGGLSQCTNTFVFSN